MKAVTFSHSKDWALKAGSYRQARSITLLPVSRMAFSPSQTLHLLRGTKELEKNYVGNGLSSCHRTAFLKPVHMPTPLIGRTQRHTLMLFPCRYQGGANKPMGNHRLAIGTDISSAEDRKPHPTRSSKGLIFRTKALKKVLQPPSPTQHHTAATSLPDTHVHMTFDEGETTVQQTLCWKPPAGKFQVSFKALL